MVEEKLGWRIKVESRKRKNKGEKKRRGQGLWKLSFFIWLCLLTSVRSSGLLWIGLIPWFSEEYYLDFCLFVCILPIQSEECPHNGT